MKPGTIIPLVASVGLFAYSVIDVNTDADALQYVGKALSFETGQTTQTHARVYALAEAFMERTGQNEQYKWVTASNPYREHLATSSEFFWENVECRWHGKRLALIVPLFLLYKTGMNPYAAMHLVNILATVGALMLTVLVIAKDDWPGRLVMCLGFVAVGGDALGRIGTCDAVSTLLSAAVLLAVVRCRLLALFLIPTLVLIRPDNVMLCGLFLLWFWFQKPGKRPIGPMLSGWLCAVFYWLMMHVVGQPYGWFTVIMDGILQANKALLNSGCNEYVPNWDVYWNVLKFRVPYEWATRVHLAYFPLLVGLAWLMKPKGLWRYLAWAVPAYTLARFILCPVWLQRYMVWAYCAMLLILIVSRKPKNNPHPFPEAMYCESCGGATSSLLGVMCCKMCRRRLRSLRHAGEEA